MKKLLLLILINCCGAGAAFCQADDIIGQWLSEDKDGKIEIYKTGNKYNGKLVWAERLFEADGITPRKDEKNPNAKLRQLELKGLVLLSNFVYDDGVYTDGKIYDPKSGKTYSCKMSLTESKLTIRGYIGISLIGRNTTWTRVQ